MRLSRSGFRFTENGHVFLLLVLVGVQAFLKAETSNFLFVGNSFTHFNDMTLTFAALADSAGESVTTSTRWGYPDEQETLDLIDGGGYEYVILQGHSTTAWTPDVREKFEAAVPVADSVITANGGLTVLYMTWAYKGEMDEKQDTISEMYLSLAQHIDGLCAPAGDAWRLAVDDGWADLYRADNYHPNKYGAYLTACSFFAAIFERTPEGIAHYFSGDTAIDSSDAVYFQKLAWNAYQNMIGATATFRGIRDNFSREHGSHMAIFSEDRLDLYRCADVSVTYYTLDGRMVSRLSGRVSITSQAVPRNAGLSQQFLIINERIGGTWTAKKMYLPAAGK